MSSNVNVHVRVRPPSSYEISDEYSNVVSVISSQSLRCTDPECHDSSYHSFTFDHVFPPSSSQDDVYNHSTKPLILQFLKGYNSTVLAYGQTGSGKTYTMNAIIPKSLNHIFSSIDSSYKVNISYFEIYLERIRDLLNPELDNLNVIDDPVSGVSVQGATSIHVTSPQQALDLLEQGNYHRASAPNTMNLESSRSHALFLVSLSRTTPAGEVVSRLFMCDLAGSEKLTKTQATGCRLDEAKRINTSLLALGQVVSCLTSVDQSNHIPYRNSKLTRILQDSLGGNSKTAIIVMVSPSSFSYSETLSSLKFGQRAKKIKNEVWQNVVGTDKELKSQLNAALEEIKRLKGRDNALVGKKVDLSGLGWERVNEVLLTCLDQSNCGVIRELIGRYKAGLIEKFPQSQLESVIVSCCRLNLIDLVELFEPRFHSNLDIFSILMKALLFASNDFSFNTTIIYLFKYLSTLNENQLILLSKKVVLSNSNDLFTTFLSEIATKLSPSLIQSILFNILALCHLALIPSFFAIGEVQSLLYKVNIFQLIIHSVSLGCFKEFFQSLIPVKKFLTVNHSLLTIVDQLPLLQKADLLNILNLIKRIDKNFFNSNLFHILMNKLIKSNQSKYFESIVTHFSTSINLNQTVDPYLLTAINYSFDCFQLLINNDCFDLGNDESFKCLCGESHTCSQSNAQSFLIYYLISRSYFDHLLFVLNHFHCNSPLSCGFTLAHYTAVFDLVDVIELIDLPQSSSFDWNISFDFASCQPPLLLSLFYHQIPTTVSVKLAQKSDQNSILLTFLASIYLNNTCWVKLILEYLPLPIRRDLLQELVRVGSVDVIKIVFDRLSRDGHLNSEVVSDCFSFSGSAEIASLLLSYHQPAKFSLISSLIRNDVDLMALMIKVDAKLGVDAAFLSVFSPDSLTFLSVILEETSCTRAFQVAIIASLLANHKYNTEFLFKFNQFDVKSISDHLIPFVLAFLKNSGLDDLSAFSSSHLLQSSLYRGYTSIAEFLANSSDLDSLKDSSCLLNLLQGSIIRQNIEFSKLILNLDATLARDNPHLLKLSFYMDNLSISQLLIENGAVVEES
ncbi:hypothetical protein P9112_004416 [Eukaryota sp. TZLM1-RC]